MQLSARINELLNHTEKWLAIAKGLVDAAEDRPMTKAEADACDLILKLIACTNAEVCRLESR